MKRLAAVLALGLAISGTLGAQEQGWFVTAQAGVADYETTQKTGRGFFGETDDDSFAWAVGLGYDFNRNIGVRGMFERSTDHATTNLCPPNAVCPAILIREDTDFTNWSVVAMPRLPLGSRTNLYGTFGLQYWDADGGPQLPGDDDVEFLFGGGLEFSLTPHLAIGGEAQASAADYLAGRFVVRYSF
ncbi:MAG: outer membrane beta-barrel protein [Wenzhouxiangellaceae bacterium]|nr:outer membrane beta-barrel protein [Wenzhouxiangellaceae bacterium]